jgi:hypothetical protein
MREDRHWEHDHERDYVRVTPYETVSSEKEEVEIELDSGETVEALVHYHYTDEVPGDRVNPPSPATVEIIRIKEIILPESQRRKEGRWTANGNPIYGRVLYSCREDEWVDLIPDKAFKDLEQHLLEGGI